MQQHKLRFLLELKPHTYPEDASSAYEVWGSIDIVLITAEGDVPLYYWEWDLKGFKEWYISNREAIRSQLLTIGEFTPTKNETISQALNRIPNEIFHKYDKNIDEQDALITQLFHYRERHGLRFGFRGTNIEPIYIGLNHGAGEISTTSRDVERSHTFDMEDFCNDLDKRIQIIPS